MNHKECFQGSAALHAAKEVKRDENKGLVAGFGNTKIMMSIRTGVGAAAQVWRKGGGVDTLHYTSAK